MATLASLSSLPFSSRSSVHSSSPQSKLPYLQNHSNVSLLPFQSRTTKLLIFPPKCSTRETNSEEPDTTPVSSASLSASSSSISPSSPSELSYKLFFGLGGIGLLETSYLTFLKLTNSTAFCPVGAGSCSDVLSSDYAVVFGVPLPLIGMIAYALVATLGAQLSQKSFSFGMVENDGRKILLWTVTSMATASAYFLYVLNTKFAGTSCSYCLLSAFLSFALFFVAVMVVIFFVLDFGLEETQKEVGLQLCIAGLVVVSLNSAYSGYRPVPPSLDDIDLPYFATGITTASSPYAISLAKHLNAIGAKMYGAFWCSHCLEQKEMFGREAAKLLNYKECFPNGFKKGTKMETECSEAGIEGFPTWVINGKGMSGIFELSDLAEASGFMPETVVMSPEIVD